MNYSVRNKLVVFMLLVGLGLSGNGVVCAAETVGEALTQGKVNLEFRYRLETVDRAGFTKDATASTLRTRLGYQTEEFYRTSFFLEFHNISVIGGDSYNSTRNGKTQYPVVADPEGTEVNQAYLRFGQIPSSDLTVGRQRITLDNHRFIGNVVWRQNEQTYNALRYFYNGFEKTTIQFGYITKVKRVFGPESGVPAAFLDSESPYLHVKFTGWKVGTVTPYVYLLDLENPAFSNQTYGARFIGEYSWADQRSVTYTGEVAYQQDYRNNPVDYSAPYTLLEGGVKWKAFTGKISYELLGGDANRLGAAFQTPLATLHAFQGWADQFVVTPPAGIQDIYVTAGGKVEKVKLLAVYHDLRPETGSGPAYGTELDFVASRPLFDKYQILLKFADYRAKSFSADTLKIWAMFTANFNF